MPDIREQIRENFRPELITTLFIGESVPNNGGFFYCPPDHLLAIIRNAMLPVLSLANMETTEFLIIFKSYGWFLDDLTRQPVDHLPRRDRTIICQEAIPDLTKRIIGYHPKAVVSLLKRIEPYVRKAANSASDVIHEPIQFYSLPFPGMGHQAQFVQEFGKIYPDLPKTF